MRNERWRDLRARYEKNGVRTIEWHVGREGFTQRFGIRMELDPKSLAIPEGEILSRFPLYYQVVATAPGTDGAQVRVVNGNFIRVGLQAVVEVRE